MRWSRRSFLGTAALAGLAGCARHRVMDCRKQLCSLSIVGMPIDGAASLKARAAACGLAYGCAVDVALLDKDAAYTALVKQQAGILVAENSMKWGPMRPSPGEFRWDAADRLVAFAEANGMKVRGHNLCWHRQLPGWFDGFATKQNAAGLLTSHIEAVATRYKGRIQSWDVVNEAVLPSDGRPDGLRDSPWLKLLGPSYIELAFRTARACDSGYSRAKLTYNDYGIEGEDAASAKKRAAVLALVRSLHAKGLIDAVGVQSHITTEVKYGAGLAGFLSEVAEMGLEIYVTEMDVNDRRLSADNAFRDKAVAAAYREYLAIVLRESAVKAVLTWGITDAHTWLNGEDARADHLPERCLPFDAALQPLQAFYAMSDAFDEAERKR